MRVTLASLAPSIVLRPRFAGLLLLALLALIEPQLESRGFSLWGGYKIASFLPAAFWLTLLVLSVAAFLAGDWPELSVSLLLAAFIAIALAVPVHAGVIDGLIGEPRDKLPGPSAVVTLPGDRISRPTGPNGTQAAGPVTVVIVQRHRDTDGKEVLETSAFEGTLRSDYVRGLDLEVEVERGDKNAKLSGILEDLADAEAVYLVGQ